MWMVLEQDGKRLRLAVARTPQGVWVGYRGGATLVQKAPPRRGGAAAAAAGSEIRAPMTGRVVQVAVSLGDNVAEGAPLVVLEAMKMEYRLKAPQAGVIATISCREGDLVDLGSVLVTLKQ